MANIKLSNLTESMTYTIDDLYPDENAPHGLRVGKTFIEGEEDDLLDVAQRLRESEILIDFNSDNQAFYENLLIQVADARARWAGKIERAVRLAQK